MIRLDTLIFWYFGLNRPSVFVTTYIPNERRCRSALDLLLHYGDWRWNREQL